MKRVFRVFGLTIVFLNLLTACASSAEKGIDLSDRNFGVLLMAHGGGEEWNQEVIDSLTPLRQQFPIEIAFGMADAVSLQTAVSKLEDGGVNHIAVVRLFVSGDSWYQRTLKILGVIDGAPEKPAQEREEYGGHTSVAMPSHSMEFWKIESNALFSVSREGLADAKEMDGVLLSRVSELSKNPENESVVILAHGSADDAENENWLQQIGNRAAAIEHELGIKNVKVFSLREDWQQKRQPAEQRIVNYVSNEIEQERRVIVIPFRVQGFGPYTEVLKGLDYTADQQGLIPHRNVTAWVRNQAELARQWSFLPGS